MRAGMAHLLDVLRGLPECCAMDDAEFDAMLALAEEEHVAAWTVACLRGRCQPLTSYRQSCLERIERASSIAAFYWSCELKSLLGAFAQGAIAVVPLKGPFLAERLYGNAALRGCRDLDLLVGAADVERAEAVLADRGFVPGAPDDYHRAWVRRGAAVELHYDVENPLAYNFAVAGALRRANTASFQGEICRQFAPADELLYLCLHAARHKYERLSLVVDLRRAFERLAISAQPGTRRDEVRHLDGLVALGLAMVRRFDPGFDAEIEMDVSARYGEHLATVADRLWRGLTTARTNGPLDWRAAHAFYMEIEEPGFARMQRWIRHMCILSGRVIDADSAFASGLGLHQTWQARLLRPARLVLASRGGRRGEG